MRATDYTWEHPALEPYEKNIPAGRFLFRQSEPGKTMIVVKRGTLELLNQHSGKDLVVALVGAGEFLGEKAILSQESHKRYFSARSRTELSYLEIDADAFGAIEQTEPELSRDLLKAMFRFTALRLDQANGLLQLLRPSDNVTRLLNLIAFFAEKTGRKTPGGFEFTLTADQIRGRIDMGEYEVEECLRALVRHQVLQSLDGGVYRLVEKPLLRASAPLLKESIPSLSRI